MAALRTPGLEEPRERWGPVYGALVDHRVSLRDTFFIIATVTQSPGTSPQPRDKRETQRPVFCYMRDPWAGSTSASWLWWSQESTPVIKLHAAVNTHTQVHVKLVQSK